MNAHRIALLVVASALLASCAYVPPNTSAQRRVSPDYMASGALEEVRAYVYADHTIIEFDRVEPAFFIVRDRTGDTVNFEKVGRLYRLDRRLDSFTVWLNGASETFAAVVQTHVFAAPTAAETNTQAAAVQVAAAPAPVVRDEVDVVALLKLSERQLADVRQALASGSNNPKVTGDELRILNARMDAIEAQLLTAATAIVRVSFATGSTDFKPDADIARVLIHSAKEAKAVNVHGHTDSRIAGPDDARIALGRALSARKFLLNNGIDSRKIGIFSTAAGEFTAPNSTDAGRSINRRVEFQFVDSRIAKLQGQVSALAGN